MKKILGIVDKYFHLCYNFLGELYHFLDRKAKVKRFFMEVNANEYIHFA